MTRILIVEDDPTSSAMLVGVAQRQSWETVACDHLAAAWQRLLAEPFDAMVLDDARVRHGVSPIRPIDPAQPALRDVLVVTLSAAPR